MNKIFNYFSEVKLELEKVTWPKRKEVINYLSLVLAVSGIVAAFIGIVDYSLTKTLEYLVAR